MGNKFCKKLVPPILLLIKAWEWVMMTMKRECQIHEFPKLFTTLIYYTVTNIHESGGHVVD